MYDNTSQIFKHSFIIDSATRIHSVFQNQMYLNPSDVISFLSINDFK